MDTSRPVVDRLLDPENTSVTLATLERASKALQREFRLEFLSKWVRDRPIDEAAHAVPILFVRPDGTTSLPKRERFQPVSGVAFFEVTPESISALDEKQLVQLLRRLVAAELADAGVPLRGGHVPIQIHIPDGGEDGRVSWQGGPAETQYLPNRFCIFQSKVADHGPAGLAVEVLKPRKTGTSNPELKDALAEVIAKRGSYIVVTGTEIVGQKIVDRVSAIEKSISEAGGDPGQLASIELYDANKVAAWASIHPSVALWVNTLQKKINLGGFQTYERWSADHEIFQVPLADDARPRFRLLGAGAARLQNVGKLSQDNLTLEAARKAVAEFLSSPQRGVRITGPSGYGKTRFAHELFAASATDPDGLDASTVVFAAHGDVADRLIVIALDLAESGSPAILVVDDCSDAIHSDLLNKAKRDGSNLRIITTSVETRTSQVKNNLVVELGPASDELIKLIAAKVDLELSAANADFIRVLARGFPRMAVRAAEALRDNANVIGTVDDLVDRIVWGDTPRDPMAARTLELASHFTTVGVEAEARKELEQLAAIAGQSAGDMYRHLSAFERRGVVVRHGDYVEVQPVPLAAHLARQFIAGGQSNWLSTLYSNIAPKMQGRLLRRLRWLDAEPKVRAFAEELLEKLKDIEALDLDEAAQVLDRLVHVNPDEAMRALESAIGAATNEQLEQFADGRRNVIWALQKLVFRKQTFLVAATLLRRFAVAENEDWSNNASGIFLGLFRLYLSGTEAEPADRLIVLDEGLASSNPVEQKLCVDALENMLTTHHFSRSGGAEEIGSAAPLEDWRPKIWGDVFDFHRAALTRLLRLACSDSPLAEIALNHIASNLRGLLALPNLYEDIQQAVALVTAKRGPWIKAMTGINSWLYFDSRQAPPEYAAQVRELYDLLLPEDPVELAALYTKGWSVDLHDPHRPYDKEADNDFEFAQRKSIELAEKIVADNDVTKRAIQRLTCRERHGVYPFAFRLGELTTDPEELIKQALTAVEGKPAGAIEFRFFAGLIAGIGKSSAAAAKRCVANLCKDVRFRGQIMTLIGGMQVDLDVVDLMI